MSICWRRRWSNNLHICKVVQISYTLFYSLVYVLKIVLKSQLLSYNVYVCPCTKTSPVLTSKLQKKKNRNMDTFVFILRNFKWVEDWGGLTTIAHLLMYSTVTNH
jgi:hypothetical protein